MKVVVIYYLANYFRFIHIHFTLHDMIQQHFNFSKLYHKGPIHHFIFIKGRIKKLLTSTCMFLVSDLFQSILMVQMARQMLKKASNIALRMCPLHISPSLSHFCVFLVSSKDLFSDYASFGVIKTYANCNDINKKCICFHHLIIFLYQTF